MEDSDFHAVADSLLSGRYNLLMGAGVSLDSTNGNGENLLSGAAYLRFISEKKTLPLKYSLQDVYSMLTEEEIKTLVTDIFSKCKAGPTVNRITEYIWNRIFSFNIDDATESAYESIVTKPQQRVVPINFTEAYTEARNKDRLQIVHLHGFTRRPDDKYVFSKDEYIRIMKANNQWIMILSQFIKSEPFIIAGTSLDEIDLRYYLSFRDETAASGVRAPSILIEPYPDAMTEHKCRQYGLILFKGTFVQFFDRFRKFYSNIPRLDSFIPVSAATMFLCAPDATELARFLGDFLFVERVTVSTENLQSRFFFGGKPTWSDFERGYDIDRSCNRELLESLRMFVNGSGPARLHIISDEAGSGKTTAVSSVLYDLAIDGAIVLICRMDTASAPGLELAAKLLNKLKKRAIVYFDQGAEAASWVVSLYELVDKDKICFVLSERSYRERYIKVVTAGLPHRIIKIGKPRVSEYKKIIKGYLDKGLIGSNLAQKNPGQFARLLERDPIALGVCRILNDFRTIDKIAETLLRDASELEKRIFLIVALAAYCSPCGVRFAIMCQAAARKDIETQTRVGVSLPIRFTHERDMLYVEPVNRVMSERILFKAKGMDFDTVRWCFFFLGEKIAPFVNKKTIMQQTPEARITRRLFDYDEVIQALIPGEADEFLGAMEQWWSWNSRYWEQKALLRLAMHIKRGKKGVMSDYLRDAIAHARHATALERHQYPLTTLATVLMAQYEVKGEDMLRLFDEAFDLFDQAIRMEAYKSRVSLHPIIGIMKATQLVINDGVMLSNEQIIKMREHICGAKSAYAYDSEITGLAMTLGKEIA